MIDLRKPLEGVPGLLLLAALVLFGATIGVSIALVFSWVEMKDSLANFLGGVVGAGLGAALAVMGAVYVQAREARARLDAPINELLTSLGLISGDLGYLKTFLGSLRPELELGGDRTLCGILVDKIKKAVPNLPEATELPRAVHVAVVQMKSGLPPLMAQIDNYLEHHAGRTAKPIEHEAATSRLSAWAEKLDSLLGLVRAL